jgi:putative ABC transport system substrate-binding protein
MPLGVYFLIAALEAKRVELLHEVAPKAVTIALLLDPNFPSAAAQSREMQGAVRSFDLNLLVLNAGNTSEIDAAFTTLARESASALAVAATGTYFYRREQLVALAARHRVPTVYPWREAVAGVRCLSAGRHLQRPHPEGRQPRRLAGPAVRESRVGY